jgi:hypothetical protein
VVQFDGVTVGTLPLKLCTLLEVKVRELLQLAQLDAGELQMATCYLNAVGDAEVLQPRQKGESRCQPRAPILQR